MSDITEIVNQAHQGIDYGIVYITLKKFDKQITTIDSAAVTSHKTPKGNLEALTAIGQLIKLTTAAVKQEIVKNPKHTPPTLTMTLFFSPKTCEVERININDFHRNNLK
jgi:hypothetical protein